MIHAIFRVRPVLTVAYAMPSWIACVPPSAPMVMPSASPVTKLSWVLRGLSREGSIVPERTQGLGQVWHE
jgi:type IV secretory pathway VirB2 component (pilin)